MSILFKIDGVTRVTRLLGVHVGSSVQKTSPKSSFGDIQTFVFEVVFCYRPLFSPSKLTSNIPLAESCHKLIRVFPCSWDFSSFDPKLKTMQDHEFYTDPKIEQQDLLVMSF
jgi:hypothetical protein